MNIEGINMVVKLNTPFYNTYIAKYTKLELGSTGAYKGYPCLQVLFCS